MVLAASVIFMFCMSYSYNAQTAQGAGSKIPFSLAQLSFGYSVKVDVVGNPHRAVGFFI